MENIETNNHITEKQKYVIKNIEIWTEHKFEGDTKYKAQQFISKYLRESKDNEEKLYNSYVLKKFDDYWDRILHYGDVEENTKLKEIVEKYPELKPTKEQRKVICWIYQWSGMKFQGYTKKEAAKFIDKYLDWSKQCQKEEEIKRDRRIARHEEIDEKYEDAIFCSNYEELEQMRMEEHLWVSLMD